MNRRTLVAVAALLIALNGIIGCAGSRPKTVGEPRGTPSMPAEVSAGPSNPPAAATPPPPASDSQAPDVEPAQAPPTDSPAPAELTQEEQMLLEDDTDWAQQPDAQIYTVADPLETLNRGVFYFNDKLYFWVMKPVAQGYSLIVRAPARTGIKNFFYNISAPVRIVNNILQGKARAAEAEWARFLYNATVGVLGFGNPAGKNAALNPDEEDMGQTLAAYGLGDGF
jgi:phospholipid-binding lipoprotein MlaA